MNLHIGRQTIWLMNSGGKKRMSQKCLGRFCSSKYLLVVKSHMKIFGGKTIESILFDKQIKVYIANYSIRDDIRGSPIIYNNVISFWKYLWRMYVHYLGLSKSIAISWMIQRQKILPPGPGDEKLQTKAYGGQSLRRDGSVVVLAPGICALVKSTL